MHYYAKKSKMIVFLKNQKHRYFAPLKKVYKYAILKIIKP